MLPEPIAYSGINITSPNTMMVSLLPCLMLIYIAGDTGNSDLEKYWDYADDGVTPLHCMRGRTDYGGSCDAVTDVSNCYMYTTLDACEKCDDGFGLKGTACAICSTTGGDTLNAVSCTFDGDTPTALCSNGESPEANTACGASSTANDCLLTGCELCF